MRIGDTFSYDKFDLFRQASKTTNLKRMSQVLPGESGRIANVEISEEGMAAWREKLKEMNPEGQEPGIYDDELITPEDTNETEMEHFFAMQEYSGVTLKDGNYNLEDVMKSTMDAYEARYNEIVKAHEKGDRQVTYALTGTNSLTLEQDLAGLDKAYRRQLACIEGYITCQQTTDGAKFFNSTDRKAEAVKEKEYQDKILSIMEQARQEFLEKQKTK